MNNTRTGTRTPPVPWDTIEVPLCEDGHTIVLARVWLDIITDTAAAEQARQLHEVVASHPGLATRSAFIAREAHVRTWDTEAQAQWLVDTVTKLAEHLPSENESMEGEDAYQAGRRHGIEDAIVALTAAGGIQQTHRDAVSVLVELIASETTGSIVARNGTGGNENTTTPRP